jgi:transposase
LEIYTVELYRKVRLACADGMSKRAAARHFNISRDSVDKIPAFSAPPGYRRTSAIKRPKLDGFTKIIDAWLDGDRDVHRKQHHTAKRVFDRLREEHGFTGGYTIIKDHIRERELRGREMFVPLAHPPGHAQADFGEAIVVIARHCPRTNGGQWRAIVLGPMADNGAPLSSDQWRTMARRRAEGLLLRHGPAA